MGTSESRPIRPTSYKTAAGVVVNLPASLTGQDLTTVTQICAAPATGQQIIITGVLFINSAASAETFVLQEDTAGTPADLFPDVYLPATSSLLLSFPQGLPVTANKDVGVKSSDATTTNGCIVFAYTDYES
jgi:hypothetical protein